MFAVTWGELAIVLFILALVWGAGWLPRLGEHIAVRLARGSSSGKGEKGEPTAPASPAGRAASAPRDGG